MGCKGCPPPPVKYLLVCKPMNTVVIFPQPYSTKFSNNIKQLKCIADLFQTVLSFGPGKIVWDNEAILRSHFHAAFLYDQLCSLASSKLSRITSSQFFWDLSLKSDILNPSTAMSELCRDGCIVPVRSRAPLAEHGIVGFTGATRVLERYTLCELRT